MDKYTVKINDTEKISFTQREDGNVTINAPSHAVIKKENFKKIIDALKIVLKLKY